MKWEIIYQTDNYEVKKATLESEDKNFLDEYKAKHLPKDYKILRCYVVKNFTLKSLED